MSTDKEATSVTVDTDTAGIATAILLSFTTLGAASWALRERASAAHDRRTARRQETAARWLHFRLAACRCAHPPPAEAPPARMRPSAISTDRAREVRRGHQIQLRHIAKAPRRKGARR
jgi:hypothetical protein